MQQCSAFKVLDGTLYLVHQFTFYPGAVLHLTVIDRETHHALGMQSIVVEGHEGRIYGTMRQPQMTRSQTTKFWADFRMLCVESFGHIRCVMDMPRKLADHYLATYEGLSERQESSGRLVRLECQL